MNAPLDFNARVAQYVKLRDKIKELEAQHKEVMAPYKDTLEKLNSVLLGHLNEVGVDSVSTPSGSAYRTERKSASIADKSAFWEWVVSTGDWDLIDYKANPIAVADYIENNKTNPGAPPPGVNFTRSYVAGVKRA